MLTGLALTLLAGMAVHMVRVCRDVRSRWWHR